MAVTTSDPNDPRLTHGVDDAPPDGTAPGPVRVGVRIRTDQTHTEDAP